MNLSEVCNEPEIMRLSAAGITARIWGHGGESRDLARKHIRRKYHEGVQLAFEYYENDGTRRAELIRLKEAMK